MNPIPGFKTKYLAAKNEQIYSHHTKKYLKQSSTGKHSPYLGLTLYKNRKSKTYGVHRLIALTFLPNPNKFPMVIKCQITTLEDILIRDILRCIMY